MIQGPRYHRALTNSLTLVAVVGDASEVDEVGADDRVADGVTLSQLDLDPLAERGKHFSEADLLVPHRIVALLLH